MSMNLIRFYLIAGPIVAAVLFVMQGRRRGRKQSFDDRLFVSLLTAVHVMAVLAFGSGWDHHHHSLVWGFTYAAIAWSFEAAWLLTLWFMIAEAIGRKQLRQKERYSA